MKPQRYTANDLDDMDFNELSSSKWCRSWDVEKLEAENARLTALIEPPTIMTAEEVTEPGYYWWGNREEGWFMLDVDRGACGKLFSWCSEDGEFTEPLTGQFIGPIKMPEVES
jgi:hypothetical protein